MLTNATELIDISIPSDAHTAIWPGDSPYQFALNWEINAGASVNVGTITMSIHFGTHVDAPFHFDPDGARAGELGLAPFWGPAVVVDVSASPLGTPLGWENFADLDLARTPRVLLKTNAWTDHTVFPHVIPILAVDTAYPSGSGGSCPPWRRSALGRCAGRSDTSGPSRARRRQYAHPRMPEPARRSPGEYELVALPLRLMDADGAPVRAALRPLR